ncbi:diguanylate cyclase [Paenibacillus chartarius]|uniref:Diguanylate cyclase n=1 Tax=Paenibacillus chartarius TaxID=747481 RepID=A0ABV6DKL6_9BACL
MTNTHHEAPKIDTYTLPPLGSELQQIRQTLRSGFAYYVQQLGEQAIPFADRLVLTTEPNECAVGAGFCLELYTNNGQWAGKLCFPPGVTDSSQRKFIAVAFVQSCQLALLQSEKLEQANRQMDAYKESRRHEMLFLSAKKLHDKIDVDSVLQEVMSSIQSVYPQVRAELLLSQDNPTTQVPVKLLSFEDPENDICTRAFMEGQLIYVARDDENGIPCSQLAAPLTGKQGVYGILHLVTPNDCFDSTDLQFISMLADIAGNAFENAKLYEQSNLLITELRLINEITKRLNQSLSLNEIFHYASTELCKVFHADCCCILQADEANRQFIVKAGTLPELFHEQYPIDQDYSGIVFATNEPVIVSDYETGRKVPSRLMEVTGARSLISAPITVKGQVIGLIHVTHHRPNFFSYENFKLLQVLSVHIGLAMSNASLHAEVQRMVITDRLTSLYVRHYLDEQVNVLQKKDYCGSLILVDVDHFKRVNDTFGHQVGDKILILVSSIIKTSIRDSDIAARWGGEELAVYLPQVGRDQAVRIAERIRQRVSTETEPQVTVSCGVSDWNWEDEKISVESLVYRADMALYEAKHGGRNQVKVG